MAFPVYHYDPNNPSQTKFPQYFDKTPFFGEWARNTMHEFRLDSSGNLLKINRFLANLTFRLPMDAKFGPDGSLYLLEWGSGFGRDNPDSALYRIDYISGDLPRSPCDRQSVLGRAPLTVAFSARARPIRRRRADLPVDVRRGGTSTAANPSHAHPTRGQFNAQLTVTASNGRTGVANVPATVGNTAPVVRVTMPPHGGIFDFGDEIPYAVTLPTPRTPRSTAPG